VGEVAEAWFVPVTAVEAEARWMVEVRRGEDVEEDEAVALEDPERQEEAR
jgi:hypothetical protein